MDVDTTGLSRSSDSIVALLVAAAIVSCPAPSFAQSKRPSPWGDQTERPRLTAVDADTNDAASYFELGELHERSDPDLAARAFWWASRLEPSDPLPLAVRARLYRQEHSGLARKIRRGKAKQHELVEAQRYDSLGTLAMRLDPFVAFRWEVSRSVLPALWVTEREMRKNPDAIGLRILRAAILDRRGSFDSALVELHAGRASLKKLNDSTAMPIYASTAMFDHAIGRTFWRMGNTDSARAYFESAVTEDLSFFMAHVHLGALALETGDSAHALDEYARAADLAGHVGFIRYDYGTALLKLGHYDLAVEQLERAIEIEPYFARAYYNLGIALELAGRPAEAHRTIDRFLALAPLRMRDEIAFARERRDALVASLAQPER